MRAFLDSFEWLVVVAAWLLFGLFLLSVIFVF